MITAMLNHPYMTGFCIYAVIVISLAIILQGIEVRDDEH